MKNVLAINKNNGDLLWSVDYGFGQDRYIDHEILIYSDFNIKKTKLTDRNKVIWESENSFLFPFRHNNRIFYHSKYNKNSKGEYVDKTILDSSLINLGDILFSISLKSIFFENSEKKKDGVQNILGVYNGVIWLNCSNNHLIGANAENGRIEHVFHDMSPDLNYLHDNRSVLPIDKNSCFLREEEGLIVGVNLNQYWELDLNTLKFSFKELRSYDNMTVNAVRPIITSQFAWFINAKKNTLGKLDRVTKKLIEYSNADLHPKLKRFHSFKVNDDFLYVSDMTLGSKTSELFIFEIEEGNIKQGKEGLEKFLYPSEYFIEMPDCINGPESYVDIITKACGVTRGYLDLDEIKGKIDGQSYVYDLEINKSNYVIQLEIQSHYVNPTIIDDLNSILKDQYPETDYCFFNLSEKEFDFGIAFSKKEITKKLIEQELIDSHMNAKIV